MCSQNRCWVGLAQGLGGLLVLNMLFIWGDGDGLGVGYVAVKDCCNGMASRCVVRRD